MSERKTETAQTTTRGSRCTIIVPCYNEAARLQCDLFSAFIHEHDAFDFLFVNDGSRDNTLDILHDLKAQHPGRIHVFDQQPNQGKAEAVRTGMSTAIAHPANAFTGFWDADLAAPLSSLPVLLERLTEDPQREMVFGSRVRLLGHAIHRRPIRHYLGRAFATVASMVLNLPIYDTQCGAKLFRITPELRQIVTMPFQSRWIFDVELIARFLAIHHRDTAFAAAVIYESPLARWEDVAGSKVGPLDFFRALFELMKIRSILHQASTRDRPS